MNRPNTCNVLAKSAVYVRKKIDLLYRRSIDHYLIYNLSILGLVSWLPLTSLASKHQSSVTWPSSSEVYFDYQKLTLLLSKVRKVRKRRLGK